MSGRAQLARFAGVGVLAALVDMAVVEGAIRVAGADPYSGRVLSYLAAATFAWALNRRYTFASADRHGWLAQWLRYLGTNALGGALNYAVYAALVAGSQTFHSHPFLAVGFGSLAGMGFNYAAARHYVFKIRPGGGAR